LAVGILVKDIGALVQFMGATMGAPLCFIFPAMFYVRMFRDEIKSWQRWLVYLFIAVSWLYVVVYLLKMYEVIKF